MPNSQNSFSQFCLENGVTFDTDRETGTVIASIKDRNTRFGVRYGQGRDKGDAIKDLMDGLTGRKG